MSIGKGPLTALVTKRLRLVNALCVLLFSNFFFAVLFLQHLMCEAVCDGKPHWHRVPAQEGYVVAKATELFTKLLPLVKVTLKVLNALAMLAK
jgi:hypothetical protein